MSGYNSEYYRLSRVATAINAATSELRRARDAATVVAATLARLQSELRAASSTAPQLRSTISDIAERADAAVPQLAALASSLRDATVPENGASASESDVATASQKIAGLAASVHGLEAAVHSASSDLSRVMIADAAVADAHTALADLQAALDADSEALSRWEPGEFERIEDRTQGTLADIEGIDGVSGEALSAETARIVASVAELQAAAKGLSTKVDTLLEAHERRLYTLRGLRDVCRQLGFKEIDGPRYESGDTNPQSPILFKIDTLGRGTVLFKLGMDQKIETDSAIEHGRCATEFAKLSDQLAAAYGVQARFTELQEDGGPIRKERGSRDLPDDAPAVQERQ
jgi:chromosome segregation ATPase